GAIGVGGFLYIQKAFQQPGSLADDRVIVIPPGTGVEGIANLLRKNGVIDNPLIFQLGVRLNGTARSLQAGEFRFSAGSSPQEVMGVLVAGVTVQRFLTVAEGLTTSTVLDMIRSTPDLSGPITLSPAEGDLLPETYSYQRGEDRTVVLKRMIAAHDEALARLWAERDPNIPLKTPMEAVILASIVEKETAVAAERPRVAAVFVNRLNKGMRLQSDPTVIYGLSDGTGRLERRLTRTDLRTAHDYNTYVIRGLPPRPIANPGVASLEAVLHPPKTDEYYFVADGTGGHAFARTLDEHNRNVARWRKIQRDRGER
ncbi:MAG: endolytic transglycosylase MltG, partial [Rhodospirillaceae bacterium]